MVLRDLNHYFKRILETIFFNFLQSVHNTLQTNCSTNIQHSFIRVKKSANRVPKWWRHKNEICEIMGFVKIFWKNNVQDAYSPKIRNSGQIFSIPYKSF